MRKLRSLQFALVLVVAAGCGRCAPRTIAPPADRFVASSSAAVLIAPSLEAFAQQSADVLATAATFPGGKQLADARAVIASRLTFDPFDATSIAATGLDPKRGLALSAVVGKGGEANPDAVLSLPVADAAKFEAAVTKVAKERVDATVRTAEPGSPEVISWRAVPGGPILFAYAVVEQTALVSAGPAALDAIRAAAAVPATGSIASSPAYKSSMKALGDGLALQFFVPAGSPALKDVPQLKEGFSFGLRGARDRFGFAFAMPLGAREAGLREAIAKGQSAALLAKLDPGAAWVIRGEGGGDAMVNVEELLTAFKRVGLADEVRGPLTDFLASLGSSSAIGMGILPPPAKSGVMFLAAPLSFFRVEMLTSLKDPARMTAAIQSAIDAATAKAAPQAGKVAKKGKKGAPAKLDFGKNPWRVPLPGGEIALAVADGKLALVAGPPKALEALLARSGTVFKAPTPTAEKAMQGTTGGMFIDVPKLAAAAKALPEATYGAGSQGAMMKSMVDQWATTAERITAVSVTADLVEGNARGELLFEVTPTAPAPAPTAAK